MAFHFFMPKFLPLWIVSLMSSYLNVSCHFFKTRLDWLHQPVVDQLPPPPLTQFLHSNNLKKHLHTIQELSVNSSTL